MTKEELILKFAARAVPDHDSWEQMSGLQVVSYLAAAALKESKIVNDINEIATGHGLHNLLLPCPDCHSPVLLEFENCRICGKDLLGQRQSTEPVTQPSAAPEINVPKPAEQKLTKKEKKLSQPPALETKHEEPKKLAQPPALEAKAQKPDLSELAKADVDKLPLADLYALTTKFNMVMTKQGAKEAGIKDGKLYRARVKEEIAQMVKAQKAEEAVTPTKSKEVSAPAKAKSAGKESKAPVGDHGGNHGKNSKTDVEDGAGKSKVVKGKKKKAEPEPAPEEEPEDEEIVDEELPEDTTALDFSDDTEPEEDEVSDDEDDDVVGDFELDDVGDPDEGGFDENELDSDDDDFGDDD